MKGLYTLILTLFSTVLLAQNVNVSFQVDMSNVDAIPEGVVSIAGSFQDWSPSDGAMTVLGDGIWERTFSIPANSTVQFKFINGTDWPQQEIVPGECGVDDGFGGTNRSYQVGSVDSTFGPICFGACSECVPEVLVPVTFRVDMSEETVAPEGVHVAGSFQGFDPAASELLPLGNGIYEGTFDALAGSTITFKFINGNDWPQQESVPSNCGLDDGFGAFNRFLEVGQEASSYPEVCFESCFACGETVPVLVTFQVDMSSETVSPDGVFMSGSFNDFDPEGLQMSPVMDGLYEAVLIMNPGESISYKFLNGPSFDFTETVPMDCGEDDGFGGFNRSYTASDMPEILPEVCFSSCEACEIQETFILTLSVDMSQETVSSQGIYVAGNFNNFSASADEMTEISDGIYEVSVMAPADETASYKFLNGPSFDFQETVPSECGQDDGFGGFNRAVFVDADQSLETVCFGECAACTVDIHENQNEKIALYPNPNNGTFVIEGLKSRSVFDLIDINGRLLQTITVESGTANVSLNDLEAGLYLLRSVDDKISRRFMIE